MKLQITQEEVDQIENELPAFARMLSDYKADFTKAKTVLNTIDRQEIQKLSITSVDALAKSLLDGDLMVLWEAMPDEELLEEIGMVDPKGQAYAMLVRRISYESITDLTRDELALIFERCIGKIPEGNQKFTAYLRHHGINLKRLRIGNHLAYGLRVEWRVSPEDKELLKELLAPPKKSDKITRVK